MPPEVQARIDALVEQKRRQLDPTGEKMAAERARMAGRRADKEG